MGWLIALGLLAAFSAALMNPYGRRLLAVMFTVCVVMAGGLFLFIQHVSTAHSERVAAMASQ